MNLFISYNDYYENILDTPVPPYLVPFSTTGEYPNSNRGDMYIIAENTEEAIEHTIEPLTRRIDPIETRFNILAKYWKRDTQALSSTTDIVSHISYQQVIGMGEKALPFIFNELKKVGGYWYWALKAITGIDPVIEQDRGNIKKMKKAWIEWGRTNNYFNE